MNDYIDQLIKEAGALKKESPAGARYCWYYSPDHVVYALWKRHVLEVLRSFGDTNPYYTDLLAVEKEYSSTRPAAVFSFFLETLKKARQFPPKGLVWPGSSVRTKMLAEAPESTPDRSQPSNRPPNKSAPEETLEVGKDVSLPGPAPQPGEEENQKDERSVKQFARLDSEARGIYSRILAGTRELVLLSDKPYTGKYEEITGLCAFTLEAVKTNPALIACSALATTDNYLYAHTANVVILSQAIALDYGLSQEDMNLLSFCAMANDLGMTEFRELYSKKEYLQDSEFSRITHHIGAGISKLKRITDLSPRLKERAEKIIYQTHERCDASGYPSRLSSKKIDLLAQIIGMADNYEAMTHPRVWREAYHPCEVIKQFIGKDNRFDVKVLKSLVRTLSVYPPASLVELSSGETVRVVMPRKGSLTRPLVEVLLGPDCVPVQARILDLSEPPLCRTIARPVSRRELEEKNPEFAARFESARWWGEFSTDGAPSDI